MRITNGIIQRSTLANLQLSMRRLLDAQDQTTTGKRIRTASDDPIGASKVMQAAGSLRALDQYQRNIASATARLNAEEGTLDQLTTLLERANELGITQAVATASPTTRATAKAEVDQLLASAMQLGNRQHEGEFLFGEISAAQFLTTNHNGTKVFLDTNVLGALHQLSTALGTGDVTGIQTSLTALDSAHDALQNLIGDVGARASQLEVTSNNLVALDTQLRTFKSVVEDVDMEKAVTDLVSRQNAYQAAMLATSRVMGLSLADYLT